MLSADKRDALANSRDFQFDANTLRVQASKTRQPKKRTLLVQAETWELASAGWLAKANAI